MLGFFTLKENVHGVVCARVTPDATVTVNVPVEEEGFQAPCDEANLDAQAPARVVGPLELLVASVNALPLVPIPIAPVSPEIVTTVPVFKVALGTIETVMVFS